MPLSSTMFPTLQEILCDSLVAVFFLLPDSTLPTPIHLYHAPSIVSLTYSRFVCDQRSAWPIDAPTFPGKPSSYLQEANAILDFPEACEHQLNLLADDSSYISWHTNLYHQARVVATSCAGDCHRPGAEHRPKDGNSCSADSLVHCKLS